MTKQEYYFDCVMIVVGLLDWLEGGDTAVRRCDEEIGAYK